MKSLHRILSILFVVALAACALPPRGSAASVDLTWTDLTTPAANNLATSSEVYEQTPTGVTIATLSGRWTLLASAPRAADALPAVAGFQWTHALPGVAPGVHTYVVRLANAAGASPPSNTVAPDVPLPLSAPSAAILTFTISVP